MPIDRARPEDIIEKQPHGRDAASDGEASTNQGQNKNRQRGSLPGEDENNLDDRTDTDER